MLKKVLFLFLFLCALFSQGIADEVRILKGGPLHEAFITQEFGDMLLEALSMPPPAPLREQIPPQTDRSTIWIPGYWTWSKERKDFIWVCGVWRRPPPDHQWVSGQWKQISEGWVWFPGFWSELPFKELVYSKMAPPDEIDEMIPRAPGDSYFWIPGFWEYDFDSDGYVWYSGKWEEFDSNWVYTPAHYHWREKGFLFIPPYWDWPLDQNQRGHAYACVCVDEDARTSVVYEPSQILQVSEIIGLYFTCYPFYLSCFHHHFYFHENTWANLGVPPWWNWTQWWGLSWIDQWAIWWWWTHPGYPQPRWLDQNLANAIAPPPESIIQLMQGVIPPPIVTPSGVIGPSKIIRGIENVTGTNRPIIPTTRSVIADIKQQIQPHRPRAIIEPSGRGDPDVIPQKPNFGPVIGDLYRAPQRVIIPEKPILDAHTKQQIQKEPPVFFQPDTKSPPTPPPQRPIKPPIPPPRPKPVVPYSRHIPQGENRLRHMQPNGTQKPPRSLLPPRDMQSSPRTPTREFRSRFTQPNGSPTPVPPSMTNPTIIPSETKVMPTNPKPRTRPFEPHPTTNLDKPSETTEASVPEPTASEEMTIQPVAFTDYNPIAYADNGMDGMMEIPIPPDPSWRRNLPSPGRDPVRLPNSPHIPTRKQARPVREPQNNPVERVPTHIPINIPPHHPKFLPLYKKTPVTANPYYSRSIPLEESNLHYYPPQVNPNFVKPIPGERHITPYYPHYETPVQGIRPELHWPPTPNALQDKGLFMNRRMPLVNPDGPSPHHPDTYWHWKYNQSGPRPRNQITHKFPKSRAPLDYTYPHTRQRHYD